MREGSLHGGCDLPIMRIARGGAGGAIGPACTGHTIGGSAAIVVEFLLVPLFLLADRAADRGVVPTSVAGPAHLSGSHHAGAGFFLQILPGNRSRSEEHTSELQSL